MNIKKILESAILAPSGDNCQPWRFIVKDNQIDIFNVPERDNSLFNYRQRASLVAHGALIENIMIASSATGYSAKLRSFPDRTNPGHIATVELEKSDVRDEPLYPFISLRSTNRKPYRDTPLTDEQRTILLNASRHLSGGEIRLLEDRDKKAIIAEAVGINDRLVFENPYLHRFLFEHIRWSKEEASKTRDGLDIRTLELPMPQVIGFRLLKNWSIVQTLNKFGLSRFAVAKQAERLCLSSSASGIVIVGGSAEEDFLAGGRLVQRVWLEAMRLGLSFQPMTGITFLIQKVLAGSTDGLSTRHTGLINDAHDRIRAAFKLKDETVVMLFRVGRSDPPSARSLRLPLEDVAETSK
jgi:nitroreductase